VEMIVQGYLHSRQDHELVIVGKLNRLGKLLKTKYPSEKIKFIGAVYDKKLLNNLRYFSRLHFHGHSVGGTNPSLLEAMACQCNLAAHDNIFNKAVLGNAAEYFTNSKQLSFIINSEKYTTESTLKKEKNLEKIQKIYNWQKIVDAYENLMAEAVRTKAKKALRSAWHPLPATS
jgi:hypothetical protein